MAHRYPGCIWASDWNDFKREEQRALQQLRDERRSPCGHPWARSSSYLIKSTAYPETEKPVTVWSSSWTTILLVGPLPGPQSRYSTSRRHLYKISGEPTGSRPCDFTFVSRHSFLQALASVAFQRRKVKPVLVFSPCFFGGCSQLHPPPSVLSERNHRLSLLLAPCVFKDASTSYFGQRTPAIPEEEKVLGLPRDERRSPCGHPWGPWNLKGTKFAPVSTGRI